jgi:two-component system nitrogen regulation response regulator NtrX
MSSSVLIVDDERNIRRTFSMVLRADGFTVREAGSGENAIAALEHERSDLVILDVRLPGMDGIETLRRIKQDDPHQMVIMISGHGTIATAVEATREGAFDFLEKPISKERVLVAVRNALRQGSLEKEYRELKAREEGRFVMIGESTALREVRTQIARAGPTPARILIHGESGSGKELVARALHTASERKDKPFVKVNCAAIPEELIESELFGAVKGSYTGATETRDGKFLQADGGTLFLDEVGDMSLRAQAKVLRALQEGEIEKVGGAQTLEVDVRVLAATNKDLPAEVKAGRFREDLFFRLNVVPIVVPPLRERRDDIPLLTHHFLERYRLENNLPTKKFADEVMAILTRLPWPGNVRELNNVIERLAIMTPGACIGVADLARVGMLAESAGDVGEARPAAGMTAAAATDFSAEVQPLPPGEVLRLGGLVEARRRFEAACIREALTAADGTVSQAARLLGIDRTNLHKKIQSLGISVGKEET